MDGIGALGLGAAGAFDVGQQQGQFGYVLVSYASENVGLVIRTHGGAFLYRGRCQLQTLSIVQKIKFWYRVRAMVEELAPREAAARPIVREVSNRPPARQRADLAADL